MAVTMVMVAVVVMLMVAALVAGSLLTRRTDGMSRAERTGWRSVTRGRMATRRRRREAAMVSRLTRGAMSAAEYRHAMAELAAADSARCPLRVPGLRKH
jgi:hypothetical protein